MTDRPFTFSDLIRRVAQPTAEPATHRPLIGRAAELDAAGRVLGSPWWAILHSVSSTGACLIHAHPISASEVVVEIDAPQGTVLSVIFQAGESRAAGELFETSVRFLQDEPRSLEHGVVSRRK